MKKKLVLLLLPGLLVAQTSCNKFTKDYDINPNQASVTTLPLLMSVTQLATFTEYTGNLDRIANIFTQNLAGTDGQYATYASYLVTESDTDNDFITLYQSGLINAQTIINLGTAQKSTTYIGIGKILKAMLLGVTTDCFGDIPERQALQGVGGLSADAPQLNPTFDAQAVVLQDIQTLLAEGIAQLQASKTGAQPSTDDFIHGGNATEWIRTAYILQARYANRLSRRDAAGSATQALAALDKAYAAGLQGSADDANALFTSAPTNLNQFYAFNQARGNYIKMGARLVDLLKSLNDPRLPIYALPDATGGYSGTPLASVNTNTSDIGTYFASPAAPIPLVTFVEAKFIEAEAALRAGNSTRAQAAFIAAISEHLTKLGVAPASRATYLAANGKLDASAGAALSQIMTQKYIANFLQLESWNDYRRTRLPVLTPDPDGIIKVIPQRLPLGQTERINNRNAVAVDDLTVPVYWAQ